MTKLIALIAPLVATLALYVPSATAPSRSEYVGPAPASRAWFRVEHAGYYHLVVHAPRRCPDARFDVEYRSVGARTAGADEAIAEGRLESVKLLDDGERLAATLRLPLGDTVFAVTPAAGSCSDVAPESVELVDQGKQ